MREKSCAFTSTHVDCYNPSVEEGSVVTTTTKHANRAIDGGPYIVHSLIATAAERVDNLLDEASADNRVPGGSQSQTAVLFPRKRILQMRCQ